MALTQDRLQLGVCFIGKMSIFKGLFLSLTAFPNSLLCLDQHANSFLFLWLIRASGRATGIVTPHFRVAHVNSFHLLCVMLLQVIFMRFLDRNVKISLIKAEWRDPGTH